MTAANPTPSVRHDESADRQAANRAVQVSAIGLAATGMAELALAIFTGSVALLGDAIHNLSDVSTSAVVFFGFRISKRPPSARYAYGYERAEDLAGLGVALVVWASAVFAGYESVHKLLTNEPTNHVTIGMAGAVLGILGNQLVARYKLRVGKRIQSATLVADAHHSWLDAISSLGAFVGLLLVFFGFRLGDPIAGCAVTLFIINVGREVTGTVMHRLMDGSDPADIEEAKVALQAFPEITAAAVKARWLGRSLVLEVEADLDSSMTLESAAALGRRVEEAVYAANPSVRRIRWIASARTS